MTVEAIDFLTEAKSLDVPTELTTLLQPQEQKQLRSDLERIAEARRLAAMDGAALRLS